jgi:hypothetical protein
MSTVAVPPSVALLLEPPQAANRHGGETGECGEEELERFHARDAQARL